MTNSSDHSFNDLYNTLMEYNFLKPAVPAFGKEPALDKVRSLVNAGGLQLPAQFRTAYSDPLEHRLTGLFERLKAGDSDWVNTLESLTGSVYQQMPGKMTADLHRFLAVISNFYRSFLDSSKRVRLNLPLLEVLPPLAVFQSDPQNGPFTITVEQVKSMIGGCVGVVSLPATFAGHPFLYGSLAHETGGHDVLHANPKLLPEIRKGVYSLFTGNSDWQGVLWDYWMDEVASDVYGLLNIGPSFGVNLAALLAVFIGQFAKQPPKSPLLRTYSGSDGQGYMDDHPTDILRLALAQGVIGALKGLTPAIANRYIAQLDELATICAPAASTVELEGFARVKSGKTVNFNNSVPLDQMQLAARKVGNYIATAAFDALAGHSIQDIETWDDADESAASHIASSLLAGNPVNGAGDDAQIIAGMTLALLQQPGNYQKFNELVNAALDDSFNHDPYWALPSGKNFILRSTRKLPAAASGIDPYAERIIDYNPLDADFNLMFNLGIVTSHAIKPIPWPNKSNTPQIVNFTPVQGAPLPKCDCVLITWTAAEANAMAAALTPGYVAMPPTGHTGNHVWYKYTHKFSEYVPGLTGHSPSMQSQDLGKYFLISLNGKKVLCFKSSLHLARDGQSMPVKDLFKQIAKETGASLIITTGTACAIGSKFILGDAVIATTVRFDCMGRFKNESFNGKTFNSNFKFNNGSIMARTNGKLIGANASQLPASNRAPKIFYGDTVLGEPNVVVTTDIFAYDDATNHYGLQGLGSMVEMDDAVLALACEELGSKAPHWLSIRNASDPQVSATFDKDQAAKIYEKYGYWTSLTSVIASWACVLEMQ
ncbi:hypothetical protein A4D02_33100 [Niastella koreensis]|uniref:Nucleoside phosphorylase domain-containing protein n=2 Tax=Niastella koreensis TaxID=354356 RepID=G8TGJ5_NIAKG|nr:hypothetical protein [Niastella koreensis]AEV97418.1 hypothetical protein Niako_1039 [Niastella koreensis GR20-10]OQP45499.1 hypothetical protein A4D02_33100 [Niastella koreensis]